MNYIEYHGAGISFEEYRVEVKEVRRRFGISGRKSMFMVNSGGALMRHIPDYIDFIKKEKIVIEAISDFELG
jgi:hypothetical protein